MDFDRRPQLVAALAFLAACLTSCGRGGIERFDVTGNVTHSGRPVAAGVILFEPDAKSGNSGPAGFAEIRSGRYATLPNRGIVGGKHVVKIHAGDGQNVDVMRPYGNVIPQSGEYRTRVDLPRAAATHDFEIPSATTRP